jgi:tetratricopeptide (TPR) repeat protein
MTNKQDLGKHVVVDTSEARLARIWSGVSSGLEKNASPARRFVVRGAAVLVVVVAVAAAMIVFGRLRDPNFAGSPFHQAALETAGDALVVDLHDGSRIELDARTRVEVLESIEENLSMRLRRGKVACDLVPKPGRRFTLFASSVEVRVTGTRFSVELAPNGERVEVTVERGSVEVTSPLSAEPKRRLTAGERWSIDLRPGEPAAAASPVAPEPFAEPKGVEPTPEASDRPSDGADAAATPGARELFDLGNAARRAGDNAGAARAYETLLAKHAHDPRAGLAAFELGRLRLGPLGDARGAVQAFRRAIKLAPGAGFREDAMARLVDAYARLGERVACRSARDAYLAEFPSGVHRGSVALKCGAP